MTDGNSHNSDQSQPERLPAGAPRETCGNLSMSEDTEKRLILGFVLLGVVARAIRYGLCFPLWEDEAFLCTNLIHSSFGELTGTLQFQQVAPVLFLWSQLAVVKVLGFSEWSLRLFPFVCSLVSLFLFRSIAIRVLQGPARVAAIAVFCVAYPGIRYAAEAKQYSADLCVALFLLHAALRWLSAQDHRWPAVWLIVGVPVCVGLSFPAVFTAGAVSVLMMLRLSEGSSRSRWACWGLYNAVLLSAFAGVLLLSRRVDSGRIDFMQLYWSHAFPPFESVSGLAAWLVRTHAGEFLAYPVGSGNGGSAVTLALCAVGLGSLIYRRRWDWLVVCAGPLVLHLIAAGLGRYPYGGHVKFSVYASGSICLLLGAGTATALSLIRESRHARRVSIGLLMVCGLIATGSIARDVARPWKSRTDLRARAFAQWFWFNAEFEGEVVCLRSDLGLDFSPENYRQLSWSAMYLCNQAIYSPRHQQGGRPRWDRVRRGETLRIVHFRSPRFPHDDQALAAWLHDTQSRYELCSREVFAFPCYDKSENGLRNVDYVEIYRFRMRTQSPTMPGELAIRADDVAADRTF